MYLYMYLLISLLLHALINAICVGMRLYGLAPNFLMYSVLIPVCSPSACKGKRFQFKCYTIFQLNYAEGLHFSAFHIRYNVRIYVFK